MVGIGGVLISILITLLDGAAITEIMGQALFVPVLFFALHYGRSYGYIAASCAALIFLIAKSLDFDKPAFDQLTREIIVAQAALFGLVGIIGGELASRLKYIIVKFADDELIDRQTQLFSEQYVQKLVVRLLAGFERYERPFSLVFITLKNESDSSSHARHTNRLAGIIRSNVRIMDEVGCLDDGRFCLILPDTNGKGAKLVLKRLTGAYGKVPRLSNAAVDFSGDILTMPEDIAQIEKIAGGDQKSKITA